MDIFLAILVQVAAGLIAFNLWGFNINSIPFKRFIVGWTILVAAVTVTAKMF